MTSSSSESGSWSRNSILWIQVATMLRTGSVSDQTINLIRERLFNKRHLQSVSVTASSEGYRTAVWKLRIDWSRHRALLATDRVIDRTGPFAEDGTSYALDAFVGLINEHFSSIPGQGRGWTFESTLDFKAACELINVGVGTSLPAHPGLHRQDGLAIPGLSEAVIEIFGID